MDGVSAAASVAQLVFMAGNVVWELKQFYDATKTIQETITGLITEVQGLTKVLTDMNETFSCYSESEGTPELATYWFNVKNALKDGNMVLHRLQDLLQAVDRPGKVFEKGRKKVRLEAAKPQIDIYRQHVQSYKEILQLCLQTVIFCNQMADRESTNVLMVSLSELHQSVHQNASRMNDKLCKLEQLATSRPEEVQIAAMGRLKECVKSVADVVTTASTMVASDRSSTVLPSEFNVYFPENRDYMLSRLLEDGEIFADPRSYLDTPDLADSDDESDSDSELESDINRVILDDRNQMLADGKVTDAEKLLQDRLVALEGRERPGAPTTIRHEGLYREVQLALASVLLTKGDHKSADKHARSALKGYKKLGNSEQELLCLRLLADIAKARGQYSYYDVYTKMCAKLKGTRADSLTLDNLASLAPSVSHLSSRTTSPPVDQGGNRSYGGAAERRTVEDVTNNNLPLPMVATDHHSVASCRTGPYEDAPEYPDISTVLRAASSRPIRIENAQRVSRRQLTAATNFSYNIRDLNSPTTVTDASSSSAYRSASKAFATPELNVPAPQVGSDTAPQSMPTSTVSVLSKNHPVVLEKLAAPTLFNSRAIATHTAVADSSSDPAISPKSTPTKQPKVPRIATNGGWSRSGYVRTENVGSEDSSTAKRGLFGKFKLRTSSSSIAEVVDSGLGKDAPPRLPEVFLTSSPTGSSIEKNWVQIPRDVHEAKAAAQDPKSAPIHSVVRKRKVICVGDSGVGKTCLLSRQKYGGWQETPGHKKTSKALPTAKQDQPTFLPPGVMQLNNPYDRQPLELTTWDTPGQASGFELLRQQSYPGSNVVLVCFALDDHSSLANVQSIWHPEIKQHSPDVPVILVGCKSDLHHAGLISSGNAEAVRKSIGASMYLECSAVTGHNIASIFEYICVWSCSYNGKKLASQSSTENTLVRRATGTFLQDDQVSPLGGGVAGGGRTSPGRMNSLPNV